MLRRCLAALIFATLVAPGTAAADSASLLAKAQAADPVRYAFVVANKAEVRATADNRSFTIWWQPSGSNPPRGVIVPLHGHDGYATEGIALWQPYAAKYGYAVLSLQWWLGGGEAVSDYYTPDEIYPIVAARLAEKGVAPGTVFFNGFSRGSANSYAVAARDAAAGGARYFGLVMSNAGGVMANYPPNQAIESGTFGATPFAGLSWAMYCGRKDPDPATNGCPAMSAARAWVSRYGASVVLFIDDPQGGHGGFMLDSANVETALATFASLLAARPAAPSCTLTASPSWLSAGGGSTLEARCTPAATAYAWSGGSCSGTSGPICTASPSATTRYTVAGASSGGWGAAAAATVTVGDAVPPSEADCLFSWAEDRFPSLLSPPRPASQATAPYHYRLYGSSGTALGISALDNRLYYLDARGQLVDLGLAAGWSAQAGCR